MDGQVYDLEDPKVRAERRQLLTGPDVDADEAEARYVRSHLVWDTDEHPDPRLL